MSEYTNPADLDWVRAAPDDATGPGPWIEVAFGPADHVYLRETSNPENVVTTTRRKWDAFVLGVRAGEFDHFVAGLEAVPGDDGRTGAAALPSDRAGTAAHGSTAAAGQRPGDSTRLADHTGGLDAPV